MSGGADLSGSLSPIPCYLFRMEVAAIETGADVERQVAALDENKGD